MKVFSTVKKWLFAVIFAVFCIAILSACADDKTVAEISISENSVPSVYDVDQTFPKDAKITVTYKSGKSETLPLDFAANVTGFDTSLSGTRTMTVSYGGKSLDLEYNVKGQVNTKARLSCEISEGSAPETVKLVLKLSGLDTLTRPLYAIRIATAYESDKFEFVSARASGENFSLQTHETQGSVSVVVYGNSAADAISSDGIIAELEFLKTSDAETFGFGFSGGYAGYEEIDASDGEQMLFLPSFGLERVLTED